MYLPRMNILYIHGFGSQYDPKSDKVVALSALGHVDGVNLDYTSPIENTKQIIKDAIVEKDIDLLIGTSMGGHMSYLMGNKYSIPYVMINPAIDPATSLQKYIGTGVDYYERSYTMNADHCSQYNTLSNAKETAPGLLLLDMDDDVIDANETYELFKDNKSVSINTWKNGSHRFDHIEESLSLIDNHMAESFSYGFGNN